MKALNRLKPVYYKLRRILIDTEHVVRDAQLFIAASSMAYTTILSLVPVLALSFVVFRAFGGLDKLFETVEPTILGYLSEGSSQAVLDNIRHFIDNVNGSTLGVGGLIGLIFTSMSLMLNIENTVNRIWKVTARRPLFYRLASYWVFITLGPIAASIGLGIATSSNLPLSRFLPTSAGLFALVACFLTAAYKLIPNTPVRFKFALISGFWTAVAFNIIRVGYVLYINKFASYNRIYGSLAAVPILLLWIYLLWLIVLSGAAFTASLQKRLDRDNQASRSPLP